MNKKITIGIVIAVVVVAGLVWLLVGRGPAATSGNQVAGTSTSATSMKALLSSGTSQKCTFQYSTSTVSEQGTVYVGGGHMRGDFTANIENGQTVQSHMISDGTTSWVWTDQAAQGMKMSFDATTTTQAQGKGSAQENSSVSPDQQVNYNCSGWSPDQSEFTLPTNVTFTDMAQMMTNIQAGASAGAGAKVSGSAAMCAQCNSITNASGKASCLQALGCAQ